MARRGFRVSAVESEFPANVVVLRAVDSTNSFAKRWLDTQAGTSVEETQETLVLAVEQTAGRGRQGREWVSWPGSGIYLTLIRELRRLKDLELLPVAVAVGLATSLRTFGVPVALKWPNDLMIAGQKLGGVLIETTARSQEAPVAVIGVGVNYGHSIGELPTPESTSLRVHLGDLPALDLVVQRMVGGIRHELDRLEEPDRVARLYSEMSVHRPGDRIRCLVGSQAIDGTFCGFNSRGFLQVETADQVRIINSGEIIAHSREAT